MNKILSIVAVAAVCLSGLAVAQPKTKMAGHKMSKTKMHATAKMGKMKMASKHHKMGKMGKMGKMSKMPAKK